MPPHLVEPARRRPAGPAAAVLLLLAALGPARAAPPPAEPDAAQAVAALAVAQDRSARADATVADLKRELSPGHLTDPMPDIDRAFGFAALRSDYADAQRRAAGYRATLGDQHPTLVATEQLMADLRNRLLDGTRRALASAERDAADARGDAAAAERRAAAARSRAAQAGGLDGRGADATGSVSPPPRPAVRAAASPLSLPPAVAAAPVDPAADDAPALAGASGSARGPLRIAAAAAVAALAVLSAGWAAMHLLGLRLRAGAPAARRVEPALSTTAAEADVATGTAPPVPDAPPERAPEPSPPGPNDAVPVLRRSTPPRSGDGEAPAAASRAGRVTILASSVAGLPDPDADAAALALAREAAAEGCRTLILEARTGGRLRGSLVPAGTVPMLIEVGGAARTLYRLGRGDAAVAVAPSDAGEAEAAATAARRAGTAWTHGFDAFDTVILVGDDPEALAASADLVLLVAPAGTAPATLAEAARPLRASGRACSAVLVDAPPARGAAPPRRRPVPDGPSAARFGLRGSIEPARRRISA